MLAGNAMFLLASVACGMASSEPTLLAARVVQGLGAAFMATGGIALVALSFPNVAQRTRAFGAMGTAPPFALAAIAALLGVIAALALPPANRQNTAQTAEKPSRGEGDF